MDLAPARLCARECLDCALQRAVRPRRARHRHLTRIRARRKRSRRLSKRSDALDYSKRLAGERSSHPEHCAYFIEPRFGTAYASCLREPIKGTQCDAAPFATIFDGILACPMKIAAAIQFLAARISPS